MAVLELQLRVAVCGDAPKVTLAGSVHVSPAGAETEDSVTTPVNPFTPVTVTVEVPEAPARI